MNRKHRRRQAKKAPRPNTGASPNLDEAIRLHQRGDLKAARRIYDRILAAHPDHAMALNLSGVLAHQNGEDMLAIKRLMRALELEPGNDSFHNNIGEIYRNTGDLDQAQRHLKRCLEINPDDCSAHNNLGNILLKRKQYDEAIGCFRKSLEIHPDFTKALYNLGLAFTELWRPHDAITHLTKAVALDSAFADGHAKLGEALYQTGRLTDALDHFRQAMALENTLAAVDPVMVLNNLAGALRRLRRTDEATACFREAAKRKPNSAFHLAGLAGWLEEIHSQEEARRLAEQALSLDPGNVMASLVLARIEMRAGKLDKAKSRLTRLLGAAPEDELISGVHMELGRIHDRMKQPDKAFACWREGNRRLADSLKWRRIDKESFLRKIERLTAWSSAAKVIDGSHEEPGDGLDDPVFLVGFPRSGTTLLEQVIAAGGFTATDEMPFVSGLIRALPAAFGEWFRYPEDLDRITPDVVLKLRAEYWRLVDETLDDPVLDGRLLDKYPLNICDLGFIRRIFPAARVIVVLRDPRDSCLSNFMQTYEPNHAMALFLDIESTAEAYASVMNLWLNYREGLPLSFLEVRYEDLVNDFEDTVRGVMAFVGAQWDDRLRDFHKTARKKQISTPSSRDVVTPIFGRAVGRWRAYEDHLKPVLPVLEPFVSAFGYGVDPAAGAE